jgi:hypothetical protein
MLPPTVGRGRRGQAAPRRGTRGFGRAGAGKILDRAGLASTEAFRFETAACAEPGLIRSAGVLSRSFEVYAAAPTW